LGFNVRIFFHCRSLIWLALGLAIVAGPRLEAQGLRYGVTVSTNFIVVNNTLTYTINLTNLLSQAYPVFVTNTMPLSAQLRDASVTVGTGTVITNLDGYSFIVTLGNLSRAQMTVQARPTETGWFTNRVSLFASGFIDDATNMVVLVTNPAPPAVADLAVAMSGPAAAVFSNDWTTVGVSVTNLGPGTATNVFLTNSLPPAVGYKGVTPAMTPISTGSNVVFNLGKLVSGAFTNLLLTVQPTNAGTWTFISVVSTNNVNDTNTANNLASLNLVVSNFLSEPGQLTATIVSTQKFNQLSGRLEQCMALSNAGPTSVDSARVMVTGLTNQLSNAVGTNNGNPFVTCAAGLAAGETIDLLLQFYPNQITFPFTNSQLQAVGVAPPDLVLATNGLVPTNILLFVRLPSGGMVMAFPSLTNRTYTVAYSTNLLSPTWLVAQPLTFTPANYTYWIDYGPPETLSHPTNSAQRFYRVFLNP